MAFIFFGLAVTLTLPLTTFRPQARHKEEVGGPMGVALSRVHGLLPGEKPGEIVAGEWLRLVLD